MNVFRSFWRIKDNQIMRYLVVGMINTIFGYLLFSGFIFIQLHYSLAALLSTVIGVCFNFKTTGTIVFKNEDNSLIIKFLMVYAIVYIVNIILLKYLNDWNINMYFAGAIVILPLAILSFILNKKFVFGVRK